MAFDEEVVMGLPPVVWVVKALLQNGHKAVKYFDKKAEEKWRTPAGHPYPESWNEPDPQLTLVASEADQYFPEGKSARQGAMFVGLAFTLTLLLGAVWVYYLEIYWLIAVPVFLAIITLISTIDGRQRSLVEATETLRRQRREAKFKLAIEDGTACLKCRRGKPRNTAICPTCGFNADIYSAEAAAKKAARQVIMGTAYLAARTSWEITKVTAKAIWWLVSPTKKRSSEKPD
jgi:hypothetical protein